MTVPQDFQKGERWMVARHQGKGINIAFSDGSVRFASLGELARDIKMFPGDTVPRTALYNQIPEKYR
jgi:prepilin-type processing-associated H-X9-DG protein